MNKKVKFILPLVACVVTLASCGGRNNPTTSGGSGGSTSGKHDPEAYNGYYKGYDIDVTGSTQLQFNLHKLCLDKHSKVVKYSQYSSFNAPSAKPRPIDQSPTEQGKIVFFYTGKVVNAGSSYTREHMWPCANSDGLWVHSGYSSKEYYVDDSNYWGGGSDLFNVRPCSSYVNTARGNGKYYEFPEGATTYNATDSGAPYSLKVDKDPSSGYSTKCEPANELKGDIARACLYMYIHYNKMGSYNWYYDEAQTKCVMGSLGLNNVFGFDSLEKTYDCISRWNKLDPVDELEKLRNNTIQEIQGNRNPFVDYPDLVDTCLGL